ncbi:MAG TPA: PQQ-binding-like beta-propeller repeat protein, partial [Vicinamibacteria bacterium]
MLASALFAFLISIASGNDWPQWRGPNRDGLSRETDLLPSWPSGGPPLVWKASGLGTGYSTVTVAGGRIFTLGATRDLEYVLALDERTGKELWRTRIGRRYENSRGDGPRGAPTVDGARIYVLGGNGDLACVEASTGKVVWHVN